MPPLIPGVRFREAYALFLRFGWRYSHQNGSHVHLVDDDGVLIAIPRHDRKDINSKLLGDIVEQSGINPDHFLWALGRADRRGRRPPRHWRPNRPD